MPMRICMPARSPQPNLFSEPAANLQAGSGPVEDPRHERRHPEPERRPQPATPAGGDVVGEGAIQILEGLEAVRKRPGMYIGDTSGRHRPAPPGVRGGRQLDRRGAGWPLRRHRRHHPQMTTGSISVTDNGRGIPTGGQDGRQARAWRSAAEIALTEPARRRQVQPESYKVSGGLHGVGVSCVNALSKWLRLTVRRDGKVHQIEFARGFVQNRIIRQVSGFEVSPMRVTGATESAAPRSTSCRHRDLPAEPRASTTRSWPSGCAS